MHTVNTHIVTIICYPRTSKITGDFVGIGSDVLVLFDGRFYKELNFFDLQGDWYAPLEILTEIEWTQLGIRDYRFVVECDLEDLETLELCNISKNRMCVKGLLLDSIKIKGRYFYLENSIFSPEYWEIQD